MDNLIGNKDLKAAEADPLIVNLVAQMEQTNVMMRNYVRILAETKEVRSLMSNHVNAIFKTLNNHSKILEMIFKKLEMPMPVYDEEEVIVVPKEVIMDTNVDTGDFQDEIIKNVITKQPTAQNDLQK